MTDFAKSKDRLAGALTAVTGAMAAIEGYHYQIEIGRASCRERV